MAGFDLAQFFNVGKAAVDSQAILLKAAANTFIITFSMDVKNGLRQK